MARQNITPQAFVPTTNAQPSQAQQSAANLPPRPQPQQQPGNSPGLQRPLTAAEYHARAAAEFLRTCDVIQNDVASPRRSTDKMVNAMAIRSLQFEKESQDEIKLLKEQVSNRDSAILTLRGEVQKQGQELKEQLRTRDGVMTAIQDETTRQGQQLMGYGQLIASMQANFRDLAAKVAFQAAKTAKPILSVTALHTQSWEPVEPKEPETKTTIAVLSPTTRGEKRKQPHSPDNSVDSSETSVWHGLPSLVWQKLPSPEPIYPARKKYALTSVGETLERGVGALIVSEGSSRGRGASSRGRGRPRSSGSGSGRGRGRSRGRVASVVSNRPEPVEIQETQQPASTTAVVGHRQVDILAFLKAMDCTSAPDLERLRVYVHGSMSYEFPLFRHSADQDGSQVSFFLKMGGLIGNTIRPGPRDDDLSGQGEMVQRQNFLDNMAIKAMNVFECWLTGENIHGKNKIPDYLVPLGEVYTHTRPRADDSRTGADRVSSTNFFLFMDISKPAKSLWLIFRYEQYTDDKAGEEQPAKAIPFRKGLSSAPFSHKRDFDTLCILNSIHKWQAWNKPMLQDGEFDKALGKGDKIKLKPLFTLPVLSEMKEAQSRDWDAKWKDHEVPDSGLD
ncbi:hypothetical protein B0H67DRAFT_647327 [Lasiosphaeris hirsuta]|uniref:Uncharacterized protein n=1 Tax=Lasiosphaeris hirsuta TaxID=260670 RepID=A0AA40AA05_9PEZI|nr:hypothetical protein B0H67DRAFT_647327 [Lasiosphaeris hirsuta]